MPMLLMDLLRMTEICCCYMPLAGFLVFKKFRLLVCYLSFEAFVVVVGVAYANVCIGVIGAFVLPIV